MATQMMKTTIPAPNHIFFSLLRQIRR
jgi:hypothetical protein